VQCESVTTQIHRWDVPEVVLTPCIGKPQPPPRSYFYIDGLGGPVRYGVHDPKSLANIIRGLKERVFRVEGHDGPAPPPTPTLGVWKRLDSVVSRLADPLRGAVRMTMESFIDQCPDRNRKRYQQAKAEYIREGISNTDARVGTFVKYEKIDFGSKPDPAPRVIQPRSFKYNLRLGTFTRVVEKDLYTGLDHLLEVELSGEKSVIKGMSVLEAGSCLRDKWEAFGPHAVGVEIDASRFDQHISRDALKWEHSIYRRIFADDPELVWLLSRQLRNDGRLYCGDTRVSYTTDGCRMSGDMNTGLGNTLIMCCLLYLYCKEHGLVAKLANNGDDAVLFLDGRHLNKLKNLPAWFLTFGFTLKVERPKTVFEELEFCQCHPVQTEVGWKMVRDLRALSKDLLCLGCKTEKEALQWMRDVGSCGLSIYSDVPIFSAFYKAFQQNGLERRGRQTRLFKDTGLYRSAQFNTPVGVITDACRCSFYFATGISPDEQIAIERRMLQCIRGSWTELRGLCLYQ